MSFINNIEIKNFKSIRHQKIDGCKRINVFVGPPNVGKSNILEALCIPIASQFRENEKTLHDLFRMERASDIFFENNESEPAEVIINNNYGVDILSRNGTVEGLANRFHVSNDNDPQSVFFIKKYLFDNNVVYNGNASYWNLEYPFGNNLPGILSFNLPLRNVVSELLKHTNIELLIDNETKNIASEDGKDAISLAKILLVRISENRIRLKVPYRLVADTLRRLIFYLSVIFSNKKSILLLEEPEANCYEPYIMEITNAIKNDKNENQFFMVTHSQYVIDELVRDEESRNDTNIYLVGLDNNETKVKLLSAEASKEAYQTGLNLFFNYQTLWDEN